MRTPRELQALYREGRNIIQLLKQESGVEANTDDIIEMAYELQSGSYIRAMTHPEFAEHKRLYSQEIARRILALCEPQSVMEAGVGEATTLSGVLSNLPPGTASYGFDLSWSRVAYARQWLKDHSLTDFTLCTGNLFDIPFTDNAVDVVYTSHSIEPNGGNEKPILQELLRVARRYLILLEPGYELANEEARRRMEFHGYCKNLEATAVTLGANVVRHELFPFSANPLNPTAITVIEKKKQAAAPSQILACPQFKTPLQERAGALYSAEALAIYPVIDGIPCLRRENAILATQFEQRL